MKVRPVRNMLDGTIRIACAGDFDLSKPWPVYGDTEKWNPNGIYDQWAGPEQEIEVTLYPQLDAPDAD